VYTSKLVDEEGAHMGVLGVNWDDEQTVDMSLDLVELGIATSIKDKCSTIDLWTGEKTEHSGAPQVIKSIKPHGNASKKIRCLPF
jgi:hypothetical protein